MIFIGDLSRQDALLLEHMGKQCQSILEFGCGGSTQILAQSLQDGARLTSLDTSPEWMNRTTDNLLALGIHEDPRIVIDQYEGWSDRHTQMFDLIFVDGVDNKRLEFAMHAWLRLLPGGVMLFHDTRRTQDIDNALMTALGYHEEVEDIAFNVGHSNITAITKGERLAYENWNVVEGKAPWMYGATPPPNNWVGQMKERGER